jgi:hypothetical protein
MTQKWLHSDVIDLSVMHRNLKLTGLSHQKGLEWSGLRRSPFLATHFVERALQEDPEPPGDILLFSFLKEIHPAFL